MIADKYHMTISPAERVLQAALNYPDRPALELHDSIFSYRELTGAAASVAQSITALNDPCPFVAVVADKSFSCYAGILGILMSGKAYLPLNPRFPAARNLYMLEKARVRILIAGDNSDEELDAILDNSSEGIYVIFPEGETSQVTSQVTCEVVLPQSPAYLLFTSGTTGKPKGVPVSIRNMSGYLDFMLKSYDFQPEDRFTQNFDLTFDLSVHDIFLAWSSGACLCVPGDKSSFAMARFIREKLPTVWFSVPSVLMLMDRMRLLKPGAFPSVRLSFFCGEALQSRSLKAWKSAVPQSRLVNLYGPTEATIAVAIYELPVNPEQWKGEAGIISIGKVFTGNSFSLLGGTSQVTSQVTCEVTCEVAEGELCLTGTQVVDSYFENEEADRIAFFTDPVSQQRFYKTGDLVKVDKDGDLFFMGRKDAEVKISGYRVNLKEIENVLEGYKKVGQAVVIYDQDADDQGLILAFALEKEKIGEKELDDFCRRQLPWYMVPGKFIFVEEIPLNMNGKVDVAALRKNYTDGK
jgi:amino acid adenylation domain-containing protein